MGVLQIKEGESGVSLCSLRVSFLNIEYRAGVSFRYFGMIPPFIVYEEASVN